MNRLKGVYLLAEGCKDAIYGPEEQRAIAELADIYAPQQTADSVRQNPEVLKNAELIFSGWGMPLMDEQFLAAAPNLKAVFYGSGSIRYFTTDAFWERNIVITSAYAANAIPVAEYTLGAILLSLKHFWRFCDEVKENRGEHWNPDRAVPGVYQSTVGLISFGMVARRVLELMRPFDLKCLVYCPFLSEETATELNVELCTLPELFRRADVVSLHTPDLPETRGMITGSLFASMKPGATFLNTARGIVVREDEMIGVLQQRPDLTAVLDVTWPEPPVLDSPFYTMKNVILTPHIAGSMGPETRRMGHSMTEELRRYIAGKPLKWQITRERAARLA